MTNIYAIYKKISSFNLTIFLLFFFFFCIDTQNFLFLSLDFFFLVNFYSRKRAYIKEEKESEKDLVVLLFKIRERPSLITLITGDDKLKKITKIKNL